MAAKRRMTTLSLLLLGTSCAGVQQVEIRPAGSVLNAAKPVSSRIAEANGHFALGNVALALEQFRIAAREDSQSVAALTGIASCYTAMGRPELAQRQYELALAVSPADPALLAMLATTLDTQGLSEKAKLVRLEIGARAAAELALSEPAQPDLAAQDGIREPVTPLVTIASAAPVAVTPIAPVAVAPIAPRPPESVVTARKALPAVGQTVTVTLPDPVRMHGATPLGQDIGRSVTVALAPVRPVPVAARPAVAAQPAVSARNKESNLRTVSRPRLERMSLSEVALTTASTPTWVKLEAIAPRKMRVAPIFFARRELRILNGARVQGLAASTRAYLVARGWRAIQTGDAANRREMSILYVPRDHARIGLKLAAQFRFPVRIEPSSRDLVLVLGTNAAVMRGRRTG